MFAKFCFIKFYCFLRQGRRLEGKTEIKKEICPLIKVEGTWFTHNQRDYENNEKMSSNPGFSTKNNFYPIFAFSAKN